VDRFDRAVLGKIGFFAAGPLGPRPRVGVSRDRGVFLGVFRDLWVGCARVGFLAPGCRPFRRRFFVAFAQYDRGCSGEIAGSLVICSPGIFAKLCCIYGFLEILGVGVNAIGIIFFLPSGYERSVSMWRFPCFPWTPCCRLLMASCQIVRTDACFRSVTILSLFL